MFVCLYNHKAGSEVLDQSNRSTSLKRTSFGRVVSVSVDDFLEIPPGASAFSDETVLIFVVVSVWDWVSLPLKRWLGLTGIGQNKNGSGVRSCTVPSCDLVIIGQVFGL